MSNFFKKNQKVILRSLAGLMLIVGLVSHFWLAPKEGLTKAELAAANVARMEASIAGDSGKSGKSSKPSQSPFMKEYQSIKEKQMEYITIIAIILGIGLFGYSFIKKEESV